MMNVAWFKNPDHVAYCKEAVSYTHLTLPTSDLVYTPWEDSEAAE